MSKPSTAFGGGKVLPDQWTDVSWNPPIHRAASGAFVGDQDRDGFLDDGVKGYGSDRSRVLGPDGNVDRRKRKGVLFQYRAYGKDWEYEASSNERGSYTAGSGVEKSTRYGFRFHYNPSTIDYGMAINGTDVNPALIMSGSATAMPITNGDTVPTIRVNLFLNRIEDMALLTSKPANNAAVDLWRREHKQWQNKVAAARTEKEKRRLLGVEPRKPQFGAQDTLFVPSEGVQQYFYGRTLTDPEIAGIYNRGTGYDLEFLFRTILGKPWKTLLRRETADVGIAFGVPIILDLNAGSLPGAVPHGQRYLGRLNSISYSHLSFNTRMVPMWTQVALDFVRYPDVVGALAGSNPGDFTGTAPDFTYQQYQAYDSMRVGTPSQQYQVATGNQVGNLYDNYGANWGVGTLPISEATAGAPNAGVYTGYGANYGYDYGD